MWAVICFWGEDVSTEFCNSYDHARQLLLDRIHNEFLEGIDNGNLEETNIEEVDDILCNWYFHNRGLEVDFEHSTLDINERWAKIYDLYEDTMEFYITEARYLEPKCLWMTSDIEEPTIEVDDEIEDLLDIDDLLG